MTAQRVRQSAISGPRSLPKAPKPGTAADDHPWVPEPAPAGAEETPAILGAPGKPRAARTSGTRKPRGTVDARRAAAAAVPPEQKRTYLLGARVPEFMRAQVDAYCREKGMSVQEFVEAAAKGLLETK